MADESTGMTAAQMEYCKRKEEYYKKLLDLKAKYEKLKAALKKLLNILFGGKGALKAIASSLLAEVAAAAGSFTSQIVGAYLAAASAAVRTAMEMVFNQILKILLAGPESIFALISLPIKQAKLSARKEALYLTNAKDSLNIIMLILNKWLSGLETDRYYRQMKSALPFIEKALKQLAEMIEELDTFGGNRPVRFDNDKFESIMLQLSTAIEKTEPKSVLMEKLGLNDQLEADRVEWERDKVNEARQAYLKNKRVLIQEWRDKINALRNAPSDKFKVNKAINDASSAVSNSKIAKAIPVIKTASESIKSSLTNSVLESQIAIVDANYETQLEVLDREFELKKAGIKNEAAFEFSKPSMIGASLKTASNRLEEEFKSDVQTVKKNLNNILINVKDAFIEYKESQFFTGVVYEGIDRLKGILKWFVQLSFEVGQKAADGTVFAFDAAQVMITDVRDDFKADTTKWESGDQDPTKMAVDLTVGNIELKTSSALLNATITESLIAMINLDELLGAELEKFKKYIERIRKIPDFKGDEGKWGTNDLKSLADVTVYVALISKISTQILSAPVRMASPRQKEKLELQKAFADTDREFNRLLTHNGIVFRTLSSYSPYQSGMVNQLKRMLDSLTPWLAYAMMALSAAGLAASLDKGITDWFKANNVDCSKYKAAKQAQQDLADLIAKMDAEKAAAATATNNNTDQARANQSQNARDAKAEKSTIPTTGDKVGPTNTSNGMGDFGPPRTYQDNATKSSYGGATGDSGTA